MRDRAGTTEGKGRNDLFQKPYQHFTWEEPITTSVTDVILNTLRRPHTHNRTFAWQCGFTRHAWHPPPDAIRKQIFIHYFPDMATPDTHFIHCPWVLQWRSMSALTVIGIIFTFGRLDLTHDDVIKWKYFPRYWPFVWGIHRSPHKGRWRRAFMFSLICVWIKGWVNNREAGDLRRYRAHYDVIVIHRRNITKVMWHYWINLFPM